MDLSALLAGTKSGVDAFVTFLVTGVALMLGVWMIFSGLNKMVAFSKGERQGQGTAGPVAINLLIGSLLVQLGVSINEIMESMFGGKAEDPNNAMMYMPDVAHANPLMEQAVNVGVLWIFAIGFVAVIRGFVLWNDLANGNRGGSENGWKGFWHIFFGEACINITGVIRLFMSG